MQIILKTRLKTRCLWLVISQLVFSCLTSLCVYLLLGTATGNFQTSYLLVTATTITVAAAILMGFDFY